MAPPSSVVVLTYGACERHYAHSMVGLLPSKRWSFFAVKPPKCLKNPPPRLLFVALAGPFCVLGNLGKTEESKLNSERGWWFWGFWGPSSVKSSVVQQRGGDVDVKPAVSSGAAARNAAPHQNPSLQAHEAQGWGA